tara:strand:- start:1249 stop:1536 length:288 start_codon:yes stop_codon:yes gene_type:complete
MQSTFSQKVVQKVPSQAQPVQTVPKKRTNLSITETLLVETKSLGINISQSAEWGINQAIVNARKEQWLAENSHSIASSNEYIKQHGLPLSQYRNF